MMIEMLWRAFVFSPRSNEIRERTVFLTAPTRQDAHQRLREIMTAIDQRPVGDDDYYNLTDYRDMVAFGVSNDERLRVFECGWSGGPVWVPSPIFAVDRPDLLLGLYMSATRPVEEETCA